MSSKPVKPKLSRSDEFIRFFEERLHQIQNHKKQFLMVFVGALVLLGFFFLGSSLLEKRQKKVAGEFAAILEDLPTQYSNETNEWEKFLDQTNVFLKKHGSSSAASIAYFYKAKALFTLGKYDEAIQSFQVASRKLDEPYPYLAKEGEAIARMELEQFDKAEAIFKSLSEKQDNPLRDLHLYNLALVKEELGQIQEAKSLYETIEKEFPASSYAQTAKQRVQKLTVQ